MVVIAAGIKPNAEIGLRCGLTVERAIVVDNHMRSIDDPDVYVVGECAQHRGRVYGLVAPLWEQAKVFADHITGRDPKAAYHGSKLATKLKVMGVELASMGLTEAGRGARRGRPVHRAEERHLQEADRARRPAGGRHPDGRHLEGGLSHAVLRSRLAAAG